MKYCLILLTALFAPLTAHAQCTMPHGAPDAEMGVIVFNKAHKVMQYCNGDDWVGIWGGGGSGSIQRVSGEVVAFDLDTCPEGWSPYTPSSGRFIRGRCISGQPCNDPSGTRAAGNVQEDALQTHQHSIDHAADAGQGGNGNYLISPTRILRAKGNDHSFASFVIGGQQVANARTADETRPKNVALLYCRKD